ncbi:MAG: hypothetical protein IJ387_12530, partial [Thermoguttaceae bacterium]|nr:hypothetical protein [Thermoguttaceae bacterium]
KIAQFTRFSVRFYRFYQIFSLLTRDIPSFYTGDAIFAVTRSFSLAKNHSPVLFSKIQTALSKRGKRPIFQTSFPTRN